jgi:hypothetical protein
MRAILAVSLLLASAATAAADGKFWVREEVPPDLPYQRAFLAHLDGVETLVVQSRFVLPEGAETTEIGWVVPVPAVPRFAALSSDDAASFFENLDGWTSPRVHEVRNTVLASLFILLGAGIFARALWRTGWRSLRLLAAILSTGTVILLVLPYSLSPEFGIRGPSLPRFFVRLCYACAYSLIPVTAVAIVLAFLSRRWARLAGALALAILLAGFGTLAFDSFTFGGADGVEILETGRAGIHDVTVLRAETGKALEGWLATHGFRSDPRARAALDRYAAAGWCFVATRIRPVEGRKALDADGLPAPLVLRFPTEKPVYPLALTATAGRETEVLLYVLAEDPVSGGERFVTRFAEMTDPRGLRIDVELNATPELSPEPVVTALIREYVDGTNSTPVPPAWLTKLKGRLSPEQMKEDLVLEPADEVRVQEHIWKW